MKKTVVFITIMSFLVSLSGCETMNQNGQPDPGRTATNGAAVGGLIGGIVGGATGKGKAKNALLGVAIGALIGGAVGYIYGRERERQYKTAEQIYREDPVLASPSAANMPPYIVGMVPTIKNEQEQPVKIIKGGQKVWLGMKYEIRNPKYSSFREVDVVEINTLTSPNGVTTDEKSMTRIKKRPCRGIDADKQVVIPDDSPEGIYIHRAVVKLGGKKYERQNRIQMVRVGGKMHFYALN